MLPAYTFHTSFIVFYNGPFLSGTCSIVPWRELNQVLSLWCITKILSLQGQSMSFGMFYNVHFYTLFSVLPTFMVCAVNQTGDIDSFQTPGLTSGFQVSINVTGVRCLSNSYSDSLSVFSYFNVWRFVIPLHNKNACRYTTFKNFNSFLEYNYADFFYTWRTLKLSLKM